MHSGTVTGDTYTDFPAGFVRPQATAAQFVGLELSPDAIVVISADLTLMWANPSAETLFGMSGSQQESRSVVDLIHPEDRNLVAHAFSTVRDKSVGTPLEVRVATREGWRLVEIIGRWVGEMGDSGATVAAMRDLTDRRRWDIATHEDERLRRLVDHADVITLLVGVDGRVNSHSPALTRRLGHDPEMIQGRPLTDVIANDDRATVRRVLRDLAARHSDGVIHREIIEVGLLSTRRDEPVPHELTIVDLHDDPIVQGYVVTAHDVSRLRVVRRALEHQALHDDLTELGNRRLLIQELDSWRERGSTYAVVYIDIDRFKPVNDLFGHEAGDQVLQSLAGRLQGAMDRWRESVVVRLSGDEFVVAAPVDAETADLACATIVASVGEVFAHPIYLSAGPINVAASIGSAHGAAGEPVDDVVARADAAMYVRKRESRGGPPAVVADGHSRRALAQELVGAVDRGEIVVHFQPIVDLLTREVDGVEALVRWNHPVRGLIAPGGFLSIAQDIGLDAEIDRYVLNVAAMRVAQRVQEWGRDLRLTVNISAPHLVDVTTPDYIAEVLRHSGLRPDLLWLEITEHAVLQGGGTDPSTTTLAAFTRLGELGVRLAVDDFGTGFSSLSSLMNFPIDLVKIDQSFVSGLPDDRRGAAMVESLLTLGRRMNIATIAEGIERMDQLNTLVDLGCRLGQGFLLGRPGPDLPGGVKSTPMRVLRSIS